MSGEDIRCGGAGKPSVKIVSLLESRYDWTRGIEFMATAFITHADCAKHDMGRHHPESPARLAAIEDHLISSGLAGLLERHDAPAAKTSELARVHPLEYIEAIREASPRNGIVHLDPDTAMSPHTWDAALHAAGAAVLATDLVIGGGAANPLFSGRPPRRPPRRAPPKGVFLFKNPPARAQPPRQQPRPQGGGRIPVRP